ncbi:ABC transporter substrate-binding protein [Paenibacillus sp. FSL H7-0331]|uniref:ABC transporter substrate-binding protein n=1 Tax=Paenibacillus sp. FSL H7-0331 TaxID=1920421 RepID=UPI00096C5F96|nr:extracellular solute-binding protein [Paenibacillus sp. FSL H7-0331]OMF15907.1 hypothetical protein BK127_13615 [Paenibacillus sp. FSL H7-0331]
MKKRIGLIASTTLFASMLLTACSGGNTSSAPASSKAPEAKSAAPVTINWWSWNPDENKAKPFVDKFNASQSEVKVNYKRYEYNDYVKTLKLAMVSGDEVDVFGIQAGAMAKEYTEFSEDLTPYAVKEWGNDWQNRFYDLGLKQLLAGSKTPALPFFNSAAGYLFYNNTLLEKAGLKPPTTYAEWVEYVKVAPSKGINAPFIQGAKDAWQNFDMFIAIANEFAPGKIYEAEAGKAKWTDGDLVKAATTWKDMFQNGIMQNGAYGLSVYPDASDKFAKGETAMIMLGTWHDTRMTKTISANDKKKYGLTTDYEFLAAPFPDLNGDGKPGSLFGGPDVSLAITKESKKKEAAWKFVKWMVSEEAQKMNADVMQIPSIKGIQINDADIGTDRQKANMKQQMKDLENAIGKREFLYPELKTALGDALAMIATGKATPEEGMKNVQTASDKIKK